MTHYYFGKIKKETPSPTDTNVGHIDNSTVRDESGKPVDLGESLIIMHQMDCITPLRGGMEVMFMLENQFNGTFHAIRARETTASSLAFLGTGGITLLAQGADGRTEIDNPSLFVTWCLSPELAAKIVAVAKNGYVVRLLLIQWRADSGWHQSPHWSDSETRQLVDITNPMAHVAFTASGSHWIAATIVVGESLTRLVDTYLGRRDDRFSTDVISSDGGSFMTGDGERRHGSGCIGVQIPKGLFPETPWDEVWVNQLFKKPARDQCAYRRRRILAYTLQPFIAVIIVAIFLALGIATKAASVLLILLYASLGIVKGFKFDILFAFDLNKPFDVLPERPKSVLVQQVGDLPIFVPLALSPLAFLAAAVVTYMVHNFSWDWETFGRLLGFELVCFLIANTAAAAFAYFIGRRDTDTMKMKQQLVVDEAARLDSELQGLVCQSGGPRAVDVWHLPLQPRNFGFFAEAIKGAVCRPYEK